MGIIRDEIHKSNSRLCSLNNWEPIQNEDTKLGIWGNYLQTTKSDQLESNHLPKPSVPYPWVQTNWLLLDGKWRQRINGRILRNAPCKTQNKLARRHANIKLTITIVHRLLREFARILVWDGKLFERFWNLLEVIVRSERYQHVLSRRKSFVWILCNFKYLPKLCVGTFAAWCQLLCVGNRSHANNVDIYYKICFVCNRIFRHYNRLNSL